MRNLTILALLAGLATPVVAADLTPAAIRDMLQTQDATAVVQTLNTGSAGSSWTQVLDHVAAGQQEWIDLVPLLAPGTADATAQGLQLTLSQALKTNPTAVLALIDGRYSAADLCPASDPKAPISDRVALIDQALASVAAILDPQLFPARNACILALGEARIAALT